MPVVVNTVQHPLPTPKRCLALGRAIGKAMAAYPEDLKVVIVGTGGMSHQLQGERAGLINKPFDQMFMETLVNDPDSLARLSIHDLVESAGSEGVELIMWLVMRGALPAHVSKVHSHYHIPVSSTAAGVHRSGRSGVRTRDDDQRDYEARRPRHTVAARTDIHSR